VEPRRRPTKPASRVRRPDSGYLRFFCKHRGGSPRQRFSGRQPVPLLDVRPLAWRIRVRRPCGCRGLYHPDVIRPAFPLHATGTSGGDAVGAGDAGLRSRAGRAAGEDPAGDPRVLPPLALHVRGRGTDAGAVGRGGAGVRQGARVGPRAGCGACVGPAPEGVPCAYDREQTFEYIFFENASTFGHKLGLVRERRLRGFAVWRLGQEDPEVWNRVQQLPLQPSERSTSAMPAPMSPTPTVSRSR
jgi:hypothetical protein